MQKSTESILTIYICCLVLAALLIIPAVGVSGFLNTITGWAATTASVVNVSSPPVGWVVPVIVVLGIILVLLARRIRN